MSEELDEALEEMDAVLTQAMASVIGLMKKMSEDKNVSKYIAKFCKNNFDALKSAGFDEEQAMRLTVSFLNNSTGK